MVELLLIIIGVTGFEPTTPSSLTKCASQLRYTPIFNLKYLLFNRQMLLYMVDWGNASTFLKIIFGHFGGRRNEYCPVVWVGSNTEDPSFSYLRYLPIRRSRVPVSNGWLAVSIVR